MDMARILTACTTPEIRHKYEKECLEFYYTTFTKLMNEIGKNVQFTFKEVIIVSKKPLY